MPQHSTHTKTTRLTAHSRSGFTMVELSITLAFLAVLLISIAIITTNIISIYQKGMTIKAVNSVGRGLIEELTTGINTAPSVDTTSLCNSLANASAEDIEACLEDSAFKYVYQATYNAEGQQYNGIFCTGYYSYIWNTYYGVDSGHTLNLRYLPNTGGSAQTIEAPRLLRVEDRTYRVCSTAMESRRYRSTLTSNATLDITTLAVNTSLANRIPEPQSGMLSEFDLDLMLYEFTVFPISQDAVTLRTYMAGTFILATLRGDVDITRSGDYCTVGNISGGSFSDNSSSYDLGSEFNYCAINKFNFAARTAGV